jgi:serine/threonine-protein kinase
MNAFPAGTILANRYEVVQGPHENRHLQGGMGMVYLCRDQVGDRPVALKTFQAKYLANREVRDRFLREGTVWVNLGHHPYIVRCYNVERVGDGREVYLVLQWVAQAEGKPEASLRSWLSPGKPLPAEQALRIALHIVWGMQHATTQVPGLVHRDLKPENVLLGRDGRARVTDFGLVKSLLGAEGQAAVLAASGAALPVHATAVVGTPLYMAPEQWEEAILPDQRADIYALGCILYELLTGHLAVSGGSREALAAAHGGGQAQRAVGTLAPEWRELVGRCVAVDRERRYGTWPAVEAVLQAAYARESGARLSARTSPQTESRAERIQAGWAYNALGLSYQDIGHIQTARQYFARVLQIGRAEQERGLEGAGLGNLGIAYRDLGIGQE